jgi:hypothetical protein
LLNTPIVTGFSRLHSKTKRYISGEVSERPQEVRRWGITVTSGKRGARRHFDRFELLTFGVEGPIVGLEPGGIRSVVSRDLYFAEAGFGQ